MYCKECGSENNDNSLRCKSCNTYLKSSDSPLSGGDRTKIISFFIFLILPFGWFGGSVVIILIAVFGLYIMKKDQKFTPIINAKKYMKIYLLILTLSATFFIGYKEYNDTGSLYHKSTLAYGILKDGKIEEFSNGIQLVPKSNDEINKDIQKAHEIEKNAILITIGGLIATPILVGLFMAIFNSLFFRPLEEHQNWIIKYGLFSDDKSLKNNSTNILGRDNLSSYSVADEMLKWNDLLEKGLVSKEEFEKVKIKLMNGEKA
jgi:hypothetical protein